MKFMMLMSGTKEDFRALEKWTHAEFKAHVEFMKDFNKRLAAAGELVMAEGLDMPVNAKIVKCKKGGGGAVVTDGPFAETKEFLAGFWIVEVPSAARAVEIAAAASAAPGPGGTPLSIPIELRQVMKGPEF